MTCWRPTRCTRSPGRWSRPPERRRTPEPFVGLATWELHLAGCASLKDKRRILKSLKDRLHRECNVSVAETAHHDRWQRTELSCVAVSGDGRQVERVLRTAERVIAAHPLARIIDSTLMHR